MKEYLRQRHGDISLYEKVVEEFKKKKKSEDVDLDDNITILQQIDKDYIETNNYAYNQHQNTQSNLTTLGKYGERVPYLQMDEEKKDVKTIGKNIGKGLFNAWLFGRNNIAVPIDRMVGRFVVAPVHRMLYNSDRNSGSVYNGIMSHRYTARKDYFTYKYLKQVDAENKKREEQGLEPIKPSIIKLAFGVRMEAINKYKEGNIAVLSAGAKDIEDSVIEHKKAEMAKNIKRKALNKTKQKMLEKIEKIKDQINKTNDEEERMELEGVLQQGISNLLVIEDKIEENEKNKVDSVVQTDAVSMQQHDKANKSNVTRVVTRCEDGC